VDRPVRGRLLPQDDLSTTARCSFSAHIHKPTQAAVATSR
jgi:hypothetical protein